LRNASIPEAQKFSIRVAGTPYIRSGSTAAAPPIPVVW
jgi:hypothetical protein